MKLYTEKQVRKAIELAQECDSDCGGVYFTYETSDWIIEELTPIELPREREIAEKIASTIDDSEYGKLVYAGALWMLEQIKQQKDGTI